MQENDDLTEDERLELDFLRIRASEGLDDADQARLDALEDKTA